MAPIKKVRRLCVVRVIGGRDYHFPIAQMEGEVGYRLQRQSDAIQFIHTNGEEKMVFYKANIEVLRFEEGLSDGAPGTWVDPIV